VNPCQDFYQFSCGRWQPSRSGKHPYISRLSEAQSRGYKLLADELQKMDNSVPVNSDTWNSFDPGDRSKRVASQFYQQCVKHSTSDTETGHIPWFKTLPTWPMVTGNRSEFSSFGKLLKTFHRSTTDNTNDLGLFRFILTHKTNDRSHPIIGIAQPGLYFTTKEYYLSYKESEQNLALRALYINLVKNVARTYAQDIGSPPVNDDLLNYAANRVYQVESYLANLTETHRDAHLSYQDNHHDPTPTLFDFQREHPYIGDIVKLVILDVYTNPHANPTVVEHYIKTIRTKGNLFIREINAHYFDALTNLPFLIEDIQNWLMFRSVQAKTFALPNRYRKIQNIANADFHHIDREEYEMMVTESKEARCVQIVGQYYQWQLSHIYTELIGHYDRSQTLKSVNRTTEAILESYESMMLPNEWLDRETSASALEKLDEMVTLLGFETKSHKWKRAFLHPAPNSSFFDTILKYERELSTYKLALWNPPEKVRNTWQLPAHMVNAFYSPVYNAFTIPLGIMGNSARNTPAVNYGRLGSIIGHEISHGFDSYGRKFNKIGDFENWWTNHTEKGYDRRAECFLNQFQDSTKFGNTDSELTLAENIADSAGLKAAYLALESQYGKIYLKRGVTGTRFTNKQLFFIAFAQNSCSISTPEYDLLAHRTNTHAPDNSRVLGSLSNQPEFSEAFQCKPTDTYNPPVKCSLW